MHTIYTLKNINSTRKQFQCLKLKCRKMTHLKFHDRNKKILAIYFFFRKSDIFLFEVHRSNLICINVDGSPNSDSQTIECFPAMYRTCFEICVWSFTLLSLWESLILWLQLSIQQGKLVQQRLRHLSSCFTATESSQ